MIGVVSTMYFDLTRERHFVHICRFKNLGKRFKVKNFGVGYPSPVQKKVHKTAKFERDGAYRLDYKKSIFFQRFKNRIERSLCL